MSALASDRPGEPRGKTYLQGIVNLLPALILWGIVSVKCVPVFVNIIQNSGPKNENFERFWNLSLFLVRHGLSILVALVVMCVLLELFSQAWAHHRRGGVAAVVWVLNSAVLFGLTSLFTLALIAFPSLVK
jgi:hypothetical protein